MSDPPVVYADDPDASWTFTVTDADGTNDWASPLVAAGSADYTLAAEWLDDPAATRRLKVPLDALAAGAHILYLRVPGANDVKLGSVRVAERR